MAPVRSTVTPASWASFVRWSSWVSWASLAVLSSACLPPPPTYRYTALTPAPRPLSWDGRTARKGSLRIEGTVTHTAVETNAFPLLHDSALHVTSTMLEGAATIAVSRRVEIGARYAYGSYDWSEPSAVGTPPIPGHPSTSGFGPEIRVAVPLDRRKRFTFGFAANVMDYSTPYAEWRRCTCAPTSGAFVDTSPLGANSSYSFVSQSSETHVALNLALYPSLNLNEDGSAGHVFGGMSAHTAFKNDGFTNESESGSKVEDAGLVFFVAAGYGIEVEPLRVSALVAWPVPGVGSPVNYGWSALVSAGVDVDLWGNRDKRDDSDARDERDERHEGDGP